MGGHLKARVWEQMSERFLKVDDRSMPFAAFEPLNSTSGRVLDISSAFSRTRAAADAKSKQNLSRG